MTKSNLTRKSLEIIYIESLVDSARRTEVPKRVDSFEHLVPTWNKPEDVYSEYTMPPRPPSNCTYPFAQFLVDFDNFFKLKPETVSFLKELRKNYYGRNIASALDLISTLSGRKELCDEIKSELEGYTKEVNDKLPEIHSKIEKLKIRRKKLVSDIISEKGLEDILDESKLHVSLEPNFSEASVGILKIADNCLDKHSKFKLEVVYIPDSAKKDNPLWLKPSNCSLVEFVDSVSGEIPIMCYVPIRSDSKPTIKILGDIISSVMSKDDQLSFFNKYGHSQSSFQGAFDMPYATKDMTLIYITEDVKKAKRVYNLLNNLEAIEGTAEYIQAFALLEHSSCGIRYMTKEEQKKHYAMLEKEAAGSKILGNGAVTVGAYSNLIENLSKKSLEVPA